MTAQDYRQTPIAPGRFPILGHLGELARRPLAFLVALREAGEVVRVDLGPKRVYFLTAPKLHRETLTTHATSVTRGRIYERARALFGDGLATSDGAHHLRQRRLIQPLFHRQRISEYVNVMAGKAQDVASSWRHGQTIPLDQLTRELTLDIVVHTLTSRDLGRGVATEIHQLMPAIMKGIPVRMMTPHLMDGWPIPSNRRFDAAADRLRQLVGDLITSYRADLDNADHPDLLTLLLAARDADTDATMTDDQVCDEVVSLLMAGTETPSATLSWVFYELARHPEVEQRLHAEIDEVLASEPMSLEKLPALHYTERVINEILRLHPTLLFTLRITKPLSLGGFEFDPGVELAYSPYALHRDPELYPQPEVFDPDRWLKSDTGPAKGTFVPFNVGRHKCIGDSFALTEIMITVVTIAQKWKLQLPPNVAVREVPAIVPRPNALPMIALAR